MKGSWLRVSLAIVCACLIPMAAAAQKVSVDYDKEADFSKLKTYAWQSGQPALNSLIHKRIVNAIDGQLASKGWTKTESAPNAIVVYYAAVDQQRQFNAWGSGPRWSGNGTVKEETILIGQLVVDIYEASTEQLLWRGFASDTATDNPAKNEKKMNQAVAKLFKQFPPMRSGHN